MPANIARDWMRAMFAKVLACVLAVAALAAHAGELSATDLARRFPAPWIVGERDTTLPVRPLMRQDGPALVLAGYVFESIDLAPLPGFTGTPPNLLVALDPEGRFLAVQVVSQHEPVFLDGLGPLPLDRYVAQYAGLSLHQSIKIGSNTNRAEELGSANVYIDGVAKATASVRIINQAVLAAALKVARAKLGTVAGRDPARVGHVRALDEPPQDWAALVAAGLVQTKTFTNGDIRKAFAGSGIDDVAPGASDAPASTLWVAYLSVPRVGRSLLDAEGWRHLQARLQPGDHALLVVGRGRESFAGEHWVRGAVPDRLTLRQGDLPLEIRDLDLDDPLSLPKELQGADAKVLRVIGAAGLDPAQPFELALQVMREKGAIYPEHVRRAFPVSYRLPARYVEAAQEDAPAWVASWHQRAPDLAVLAAALLVLGALLARPTWLVRDARRLEAARIGFAVFTLVFIGWHAQGQLSIVNLTGAIQALVHGRSLAFFLDDPMTVALWVCTAFTWVVWGRGTFCGWLCPFGALQELVHRAARLVRLPRRHVHRSLDAPLKRVKYLVLIVLVALAAWPDGGPWIDRAVEVEPFKTAITLGFERSGPFVAWAAALVVLAAFIYKGFCRYLCPLGAALAVAGRLRRVDWIARRVECGTPCQSCRHRCDYQAIEPSGRVDYDECFQCLECVAIHASDQRCAPRILALNHRVIGIRRDDGMQPSTPGASS